MKQKMDCHKAQGICYGLFFGGLACMLLALWLKGPLVFILGIPGLIAVFGGLLFGVLFVRCPYCGGVLENGNLPAVPDYCPHCGKKLNGGEEE